MSLFIPNIYLYFNERIWPTIYLTSIVVGFQPHPQGKDRTRMCMPLLAGPHFLPLLKVNKTAHIQTDYISLFITVVESRGVVTHLHYYLNFLARLMCNI
jgi:hypothetical protein